MAKRACRWPGCQTVVPASMWGCKSHWYQLPKPIRDDIWSNYRPGQETSLQISRGYAVAEKAAQDWIAARPNTISPQGTLL